MSATLIQEVSRKLGFMIPEANVEGTFKELGESGKIGDKQLIELLVILINHVNSLERQAQPKTQDPT